MSLFIFGLGHDSSKEGRTSILIGDMDISRIMVYVQQVEKEKVRGMHHNLLVHLHVETELSFMVITLKLGLHIHIVVWCKEVVSFLRALSVVEITPAYVGECSDDCFKLRLDWVFHVRMSQE